ncbi:MAG: Fis family transcriptional regulator [Deltaproteobacteria bacterium]|nr:Fis family transcriptional regulator [Deltaproteobacteria bacterium]
MKSRSASPRRAHPTGIAIATRLLAALALVWASASGCARNSGPIHVLPADHPDALAFVAAHNRARAAVAPRPKTPLAPLRWSNALATQAAKTAARCDFDHSRSPYGENLIARKSAHPPAVAVDVWLAERADWSPAMRRCASGRSCGHYTQIVWRESRELGCASQRCERGSPMGRGPWFLTVCNYAPAGNVAGEAPY